MTMRGAERGKVKCKEGGKRGFGQYDIMMYQGRVVGKTICEAKSRGAIVHSMRGDAGENIYEGRRINKHPRKDRGMTSDGLVMGKGICTWSGYGEGITRQKCRRDRKKMT